jgi:hypothetical protein
MNGVGIGFTIGLGATIALAILSPGAAIIEYVAAFSIYGSISRFTFRIWQMALRGWEPPFIGRR